MNSKLLALIISGLASIGLVSVGGYITIENLFVPQGYLFEGIMMTSVGLLLGLMITIALSIGQTIMIFGQIMEQQVKIQKEMQEISNRAASGNGLSSIIKNMIPPGANISITDLDTGKTTGDIPNVSLDVIRNIMRGGRKLEIEDMGLEELEKELAKAVKKDDYERAEKISKAIKELRNLDKDENND